MSFVGAVAAPHSHLQLFTRPAENEDYRAKVARGRKALGVLREQVEKSGADTMLVIHDDHFVNFDFRCYPPFCLLVGKEAKGSGVIDPAEIGKITGAVYKKYQGKTSYGSAPAGMPQHVSDWEGGAKPYVYRVDEDLSAQRTARDGFRHAVYHQWHDGRRAGADTEFLKPQSRQVDHAAVHQWLCAADSAPAALL
jgi:hypothetical protein